MSEKITTTTRQTLRGREVTVYKGSKAIAQGYGPGLQKIANTNPLGNKK